MNPDIILKKLHELDPDKGTIMEAVQICPFCHKPHGVKLYFEDWMKWKHGLILIQDIHYLTPEQREILVSGTDPECWKKNMKCPDE